MNNEYRTLTDETRQSIHRSNTNANPIAAGANQYLKQATPRLNAIRLLNRNNQAPTQNQNTQNSSCDSIGSLVNGGLSLMNGLNGLGVFNKGDNNTSTGGAISDAINSFVGGSDGGYTESIMPKNNPNSTMSEVDNYGDIPSSAGSLYNMGKTWGNSGGSAAGGYGGLISGGINGLSSFAQSGDYRDGVQGFFGVNKDDSDVMQGIKGTLNGATTGGSVGGPWGAAIGALLGLGSSFLDDI